MHFSYYKAPDLLFKEFKSRYTCNLFLFNILIQFIKEIIDKIMQVERSNGLNGYILQFHFGTNPGRKDKLYNSLSTIIGGLRNAGYQFTDLYSATNLISEPKPEQHAQKKNKSKK